MKGPVLALAGGVGGAKLALGLARVVPPEALVIAVNTGEIGRASCRERVYGLV